MGDLNQVKEELRSRLTAIVIALVIIIVASQIGTWYCRWKWESLSEREKRCAWGTYETMTDIFVWIRVTAIVVAAVSATYIGLTYSAAGALVHLAMEEERKLEHRVAAWVLLIIFPLVAFLWLFYSDKSRIPLAWLASTGFASLALGHYWAWTGGKEPKSFRLSVYFTSPQYFFS
jgi:amino acid transporter